MILTPGPNTCIGSEDKVKRCTILRRPYQRAKGTHKSTGTFLSDIEKSAVTIENLGNASG